MTLESICVATVSAYETGSIGILTDAAMLCPEIGAGRGIALGIADAAGREIAPAALDLASDA
jgi:hypothetical protein